MPLPQTPFEVGYSDGEFGSRCYVPQWYSAQEAEEYRRGYDKGYDYYLKKVGYLSRNPRPYTGPGIIDDTWIPKDGHY